MTSDTLYIVLGPTGVGKTEYALRLAERLGCAIVNADSRQIYREIPIGTDAPTPEMMTRVPHFFVGTHSVQENYNAGQYEIDALRIIRQQIAERHCAVMAGGSMMYIDAVANGIDDIPDIDPQLRAEVLDEYHTHGLEQMQHQLQALDPEHYAQCDINNWRRVLHAIEICRQTGGTYSKLRQGVRHEREFRIEKIGITRNREELYHRIDSRVQTMIERGLEDEARAMLPFRHLNALNTVGFKEMFAHFDGQYDMSEAIRLIQRNTRHYARKQMTWFRRDHSIQWITIT